MAKRDVVLYYLEVENEYLEMLENVKEYKEMLAEGKISEEKYDDMIKEIEVIKTNYERIAYIMFLLNKPNRKYKKLDEVSQSWYDALKHASKEAIVDENRDALCTLKKLIKEAKNENT